MCEDWQTAIQQAFEIEKDILRSSRLVPVLYERKAYELADHLNAEFRGLAFASAGCETLYQAILARTKLKKPADLERRLSYPLYADAVLAAFNARRFIESTEMRDEAGSVKVGQMLSIFDRFLPKTVEACDAIRHHHDRAFGRIRNRTFSDSRQFVAACGSQVKVTDHQLQEFWYEFSTSSVRELMKALAEILDEPIEKS